LQMRCINSENWDEHKQAQHTEREYGGDLNG
jgi:hypothetical protein